MSKSNKWFQNNGMEINSKKTELVIYHKTNSKLSHNIQDLTISLAGDKITPKENVKYLGMQLDENLNWKTQISNTGKKLMSL